MCHRRRYSPPFYVGEPIYSDSINRVLRSDNAAFSEGDLIYGRSDHATYKVIAKDKLELFRKVDNKAGIPLRTYVGAVSTRGVSRVAGR